MTSQWWNEFETASMHYKNQALWVRPMHLKNNFYGFRNLMLSSPLLL
jgi:hypothetical protein